MDWTDLIQDLAIITLAGAQIITTCTIRTLRQRRFQVDIDHPAPVRGAWAGPRTKTGHAQCMEGPVAWIQPEENQPDNQSRPRAGGKETR